MVRPTGQRDSSDVPRRFSDTWERCVQNRPVGNPITATAIGEPDAQRRPTATAVWRRSDTGNRNEYLQSAKLDRLPGEPQRATSMQAVSDDSFAARHRGADFLLPTLGETRGPVGLTIRRLHPIQLEQSNPNGAARPQFAKCRTLPKYSKKRSPGSLDASPARASNERGRCFRISDRRSLH